MAVTALWRKLRCRQCTGHVRDKLVRSTLFVRRREVPDAYIHIQFKGVLPKIVWVRPKCSNIEWYVLLHGIHAYIHATAAELLINSTTLAIQRRGGLSRRRGHRGSSRRPGKNQSIQQTASTGNGAWRAPESETSEFDPFFPLSYIYPAGIFTNRTFISLTFVER